MTRTSEHLQGLVSGTSTGDVGLLVAADQEGGVVHQLRGEGFTRPPSAKQQATMSSSALTKAATGWAREMKAAGVNVNLAPVTDTVPADIGRANEPIGKWGRQYGSDPKTVERASSAFLKGMLAGGIEGTVKHFPGLGRIRNNTDFNATGITDDVTTADDPYLQPFAAGVKAGAGLVMVGSAKYSKLDPGVPAMFSAPIVTDLLRGDLGYDGVVITDDVNAKAVAATPAPQRAVKVVAGRRRHRAHRRRVGRPCDAQGPEGEGGSRPGVRRQGGGVGAAGADPQGADGPAPLLHRALTRVRPGPR